MARIRTVKPEFFSDEDLATCSRDARLFAIAILQLADSAGRFRWVPMQVHAHAFPFDDDIDVETLSMQLVRIGYMRRYEIDGRQYADIPGFLTHQRLTGKEAALASKIPPYQEDAEGKEQVLPGETPGCFPTASPGNTQVSKEQGNRGTGEQGNREGDSCGVLSGKPDDAPPQQTLLPARPKPITARDEAAELRAQARSVIDDLNAVIGSKFSHSDRNLGHVIARLRTGMTVDQLAEVVRFKVREWRDDPGMAKFLRPETLFGPKCEGYANAAALARASPPESRLSANGRASVEALRSWADRKRSEGA